MDDRNERPNVTFSRFLVSPVAVSRGLRISAIIGTLLILINQGDVMLAGAMPALWKILLTYLVPYGVSSYSTAALLYETKKAAR
ncbi:nitrate/nitrite transporter NrtS [Parasphingopyxis lamellibrachiae]|uniref:Phosphoenolpyruvate protein kinase n=1 Tax=Parasphingopyxis lamellibrachiae TaxID=680125 RepID=A0A3D9FIT8_9SPHN|nr:nitrate/nitrite transporter NrtS [Parasphingopyxis lamellibrachiae]RED17487.1 hypothetical protein DFR46_2534 [Parasphingopyxis lamellibrachiae]